MFDVEVYGAVRQFVFSDGNSRREAVRVFGLSRETVSKMCRFSLPPGYTRVKPVGKPKLADFLQVEGEVWLACCRFRGHRDKVFRGSGRWRCNDGSFRVSSRLKLFG